MYTSLEWEWVTEANCKEEDTDLFYEVEREKVLANTIKRTFCLQCPVRTECLQTAIMIPEKYGIWGGLSYAERNSYVRMLQQGIPHADALRKLDHIWVNTQPQYEWAQVEGYARDKVAQMRASES